MPWLRNTPSHPAVLGGIEYIVSIFIDHVGTFHWKFKLQLGSFGQSPSPLPSCDIWCWTTCSFQNWKTISIVLIKDGIKSNPNILMASWNFYSSQVHLASYHIHTRYFVCGASMRFVSYNCIIINWKTLVNAKQNTQTYLLGWHIQKWRWIDTAHKAEMYKKLLLAVRLPRQ